MKDAPSYLPQGFTPAEELMAEKAECRDCGDVVRENARQWAHDHVKATGHNVHLSQYFDVRDEHWLERLSYERLADIEKLRGGGSD